MSSSQENVFVALPSRPGEATSLGLLMATHAMGRANVYCLRAKSCSLLTTGFNTLWCEALNERKHGITHFAMVHSDVSPEPGWLDILVSEQRRVGADVLSCVIPIKDDRGITSTGLMDWKTRKMKHISMTEALSYPKTFNASNDGACLLLNTGCWICDFTKPWVEQMVFRNHDTIVRLPDGEFQARAVSEDWLFSIDAARMGLKTYATTAVKIHHEGSFRYPNYVAWGSVQCETAEAVAWNIDPPKSNEESNGCAYAIGKNHPQARNANSRNGKALQSDV